MLARLANQGYERCGDEKSIRNLAHGNFSNVYKVVDCRPGPTKGVFRVVKELLSVDHVAYQKEVDMFRDKLSAHDFIVKLAGNFVDPVTEHGCLVFELCSGSLQSRLEEVIQSRLPVPAPAGGAAPAGSGTAPLGPPFEEPQLIRLLRQLCSALDLLHTEGIVHSDINPRNVLIDGNNFKLADLGVAERYGLTAAVTTAKLMSVHSSPEQIATQTATASGDVFGVGCVILDLMLPENPEKRSQLWAELSEANLHLAVDSCNCYYSSSFLSIIKRMLAYNPKCRLSESQVLSELDRMLTPGGEFWSRAWYELFLHFALTFWQGSTRCGFVYRSCHPIQRLQNHDRSQLLVHPSRQPF